MRWGLQTARRCALFITFWTGFSGLVYEVTWQRYLVNLIGSQAQASATILAVFLGGLCLGYVLFGRCSRNSGPQALVRLCGWVEIAIGAWAVCFPLLYGVVWRHAGVLAPGRSIALLLDTVVCLLLIGVPTVLMGGTLPLLTQGLARDAGDASPFHARLYAVNTGGAFLGALAAGFILLPAFGLPLTMIITSVINMAGGLMLVIVASGGLRDVIPPEESPPIISAGAAGNGAYLSRRRAALIAILAGFYSISLQTVFMRLVGLSMGSSEYSFAMVVAVFIMMLALGAWAIAGREQALLPLWSNQVLLALGAAAVFVTIPFWPYGAHVLRTLFTGAAPAFYAYHAAAFVLLSLLLALPVGCMGCTLPLLFRSVEKTKAELGSNVGYLYGWNTFGCVCGALFGGHLLLYVWNLDRVFQFCLLLMAAAIVLSFPPRRVPAWGRAAVCGALLFAIFAGFGRWDPRYFALGTFRLQSAQPYSYQGRDNFYRQKRPHYELAAYKDDPNTSVGVLRYKLGGIRPVRRGAQEMLSLTVNGKSDGVTAGNDLRTTILLAQLPALLTMADSDKAAVVGFGTGITIGSLAIQPHLKEIQCIEISPAVMEFAPFFDSHNHSAARHPKSRWVVGDAYRVLASSKDAYSVIVSEPSNPWIAGVEKLYALEFYRTVQSRLAPGGIYAQWIHAYAMSEETLAMIVNNFQSVFPHLRVFANELDLILLGSGAPIDGRNARALAERIKIPEVAGELNDIERGSPELLLAHELWLPPALFSEAGYHSLEFPKLAFAAGRDFFAGQNVNFAGLMDRPAARPWIYLSARDSLLAGWLVTHPELREDALQALAKVGCGMDEIKLTPDWFASARPCRSALTALAYEGKIAGMSNVAKDDLRIMTFLSGGDAKGVAAQEQLEPRRAAELLGVFSSPFLALRPERLLQITGRCANLDCRADIVAALASTAALEAALPLAKQLEILPGAQQALEQRGVPTLLRAAAAARRHYEAQP